MTVYDELELSKKVKVCDKGITLSDGLEGMYQLLVGYRPGDMWAPQLSLTEALWVEALRFVECVERHWVLLTDGQTGLRVLCILNGPRYR